MAQRLCLFFLSNSEPQERKSSHGDQSKDDVRLEPADPGRSRRPGEGRPQDAHAAVDSHSRTPRHKQSGPDETYPREPPPLRRDAGRARRAINLVKDKIVSMDWQVRVRRGYATATVGDATLRADTLRRCLEDPNPADSFRTLWEQVVEDVLVGGLWARWRWRPPATRNSRSISGQ